MLSQRESMILKSIVESFIDTGQPIGSRTLERDYGIGLSSATIRNVMSDLERSGLLVKPHHSSGRLPSGKAFELYIKDLINNGNIYDSPKAVIGNYLELQRNKIDNFVKQAGRLLSEMTDYATLTFVPNDRDLTIIDLFIKEVSSEEALFVLVTSNNKVCTDMVSLKSFDSLDIEKLNNFLKKNFIGSSVSNFMSNAATVFNIEFAKECSWVNNLLNDLHGYEDMGNELSISGISRLLDHPDFDELSRVKQVASLMEDSTGIKEFLKEEISPGIRVYIGDAGDDENLHSLTIITSSYRTENNNFAGFGLITPIRINYRNAIKAVADIDREIKTLIGEYEEEEFD